MSVEKLIYLDTDNNYAKTATEVFTRTTGEMLYEVTVKCVECLAVFSYTAPVEPRGSLRSLCDTCREKKKKVKRSKIAMKEQIPVYTSEMDAFAWDNPNIIGY